MYVNHTVKGGRVLGNADIRIEITGRFLASEINPHLFRALEEGTSIEKVMQDASIVSSIVHIE